jgi:hypothetical protein
MSVQSIHLSVLSPNHILYAVINVQLDDPLQALHTDLL